MSRDPTAGEENGDNVRRSAGLSELELKLRKLTESDAEASAALDLLRDTQEKLSQSESRYRALVECSSEAIAVQRASKIIYVNPAAVTMMAASSAADLVGKSIVEFVHPDFREAVLERLRQAAESGGPLTRFEEKLIRVDGAVIDVEVQGTVISFDGEPAIYGSMRDITKSKRADDQLRENRLLLNMAGRLGRLGAWMVKLPSMDLTLSDEAKAIHELPPDASLSVEAALGFFPPEERPKISKMVEACIRDGTPFDVELQLVTAKGRSIWIHSIGEAERDQNGAIHRIRGAIQDISERKAAEIQTREQAALIDQTNDAIVVRGLDRRITFWSKGAERLFGWTAAEALGRPANEITQPDAPTFEEAMAVVQRDGVWSGELQVLNKAGDRLIMDSRWTLLRDAQNRPTGILTIGANVTEKKKLETQFLRAQRMESIGTLAGGIAHDLNNLLAPITMGVELLRGFESDPRSLPIIDSIEQSAKRGAGLVKQVLSFARGIEGSRSRLRIPDVIGEVESIAESTFPKNIAIKATVSKDLWPVMGDPTQLNQVLLNLCVNARDAMPDGGRLELEAKNVEIDEQFASMNRSALPGRYVVVTVTDSGSGMPKEIMDRIFEPFFTTKEVGRGTGIGLSTVMGIVRSHGGFVNVYSELGKGSTFKVYLPVPKDMSDSDGRAASVERLPRGKGELILVVDDETSILDITKQTLQTFGYRVLTAEDGAHGVGIYATNRKEIAAVITDMMMPVMDGAAFIAALRRINPNVRIIAASGLNANASLTRAFNAGVTHFLAKPYSADTMLQTLKATLSEDKDPRPNRNPFQPQ